MGRSLHAITHIVSCKEASRLLSQREDLALGILDRLKLRAHLAACTMCSRFARQLAFMRKAMQRYRDQD